jgi:hypothetical protein
MPDLATNLLYYGDNLDAEGAVDLVYLDPQA